MESDRVEIGSTDLTIYADTWDGERISDGDSEAFFKNEQLDIMRNHLRAIFNDMFRRREKITCAKIKRAYLGQSISVSLLSAFELYLRDSAADPERKLHPRSIEVYTNVRKKLCAFLISQKATDLLVDDFDLAWINKYRRWMKLVKLDAGKIGHADSYIVKHTQTIKNVLVWAKLHKVSDSNPLDGLRVKNAEFGDPVFLTNDQFLRLRAHMFSNQNLQQVADVFIILCRCGFPYGDLEDFIKQHKTALRTGVDGKPWLIKNRIKTEVAIRVPEF